MRHHAIYIAALCLSLWACGGPDTRPFDAEREFREANEKYDDELFEDARTRFEKIIRMDTEFIYAPLAQLRLADSYMEENDAELAIAEYGRFLDTYPRHKYAAYAQYQMGMVYFKMIKAPDRGHGAAVNALDAFETLNRVYPRHPYRDEVELKIKHCKDTIAEYEKLVGDFYYRHRACNGVADRLEGLARTFPEYADDPDILWRLAVCYLKLGQSGRSERTMARLEELYPKSRHLKKARRDLEALIEDMEEELREQQEERLKEQAAKPAKPAEPVQTEQPAQPEQQQ